MDPDVTWGEAVELADRILSDEVLEYSGEELATRVQALHEWLTKGGFPPASWGKWVSVNAGEISLIVEALEELAHNLEIVVRTTDSETTEIKGREVLGRIEALVKRLQS